MRCDYIEKVLGVIYIEKVLGVIILKKFRV